MPHDPAPDSTSRWPGRLAFGAAILPALAAIWAFPRFVTQDGPAHVYNAVILADALRADSGSPLRAAYAVRWEPLPNWAGHLATLGLVEILPAGAVDRAMATLTMLGLAGAAAWLRWRVAGWRGMALAGPLAALLAMNVAWLFGFSSFLLGACLFPITLGVWWASRDDMGPGRASGLAALMVLGYFCHPVSLGLTVVGLIVLAAATPNQGSRARRWGWTLAGLTPLIPLGVVYRAIMSRAGEGIRPIWGHLDDPLSARAWLAQVGWVDPISLGAKVFAPFVDRPWIGFAGLAPVFWVGGALGLWSFATLSRRDPTRRGWLALAAILILGGLACPDTLGPSHGNYLPQRVVLLGLVALLPALELDGSRKVVRLGAGALAVALALQTAFVWDYARTADRLAGAFLRPGPHVGHGQRVATLLVGIKGKFRANPLLHVDNLLGAEGRNVVWSNYETRHYYFPVQFRPGLARPDAGEFEAIALLEDPRDAADRAGRWARLLEEHRGRIDVVVAWGSDPALDAETARWFEPVYADRAVRVLARRPVGSPSGR